jgi:pilus assembly protein Flp/PilA
MRLIQSRIQQFLGDETGTTAVEYAVMLAVIILACIGAILSTGDVQQSLFQDSVDEMSDKMFPQ